jgi:uncharacterized protein (DUF58 family)
MSDGTNDGAATDGPDVAPSPIPADRWAVAAGIGILAVGFGLVTQNRAVLAAAVVPLAFVAYGRLSTASRPDLTARRSFDPVAPAVGDRVEVTVTVRNQGRDLRDCRLADAVPPELPVVGGSPATATTLRAGEEAAFSYVVRARRGDHEFGPLRAAAVAGAGADAATTELAAESRLRCRASGAADAAGAPSANAGDAATDSRGGGVEFHAVREYRRSDPLSRVDWRRFARTGELATVEFREDRAATVAIVVDATAATYRRATADAPAAVEYALFAAEGAFEALLERDARVALAFHPDAPGALGPGTGVDHRTLGRRAFDAYGPGATRNPAEVPVALGPAGDPASRPAPAADGATDTTAGRAPTDSAGADDVAAGADSSEVRPDGGDPFGSAFDPTDDEGEADEATDTDGAADEVADETDAYDPGTAFDDADAPEPESDATTALRASLPSGARVLFCSPLLDDDAASLVRTLRADDHDVRVLSPAPESGGPATRLATLERTDRVADLRAGGVGVVDWTDEPLREALARTLRGW